MRSLLNFLSLTGARRWFSLAVVLWPPFPVTGADTNTFTPPFSRQQIDFYEKQVQPILAENCYKCHSHQADKIKASFVLDSREGLLKGGEKGAAGRLVHDAHRQSGDPPAEGGLREKISGHRAAIRPRR